MGVGKGPTQRGFAGGNGHDWNMQPPRPRTRRDAGRGAVPDDAAGGVQ